MAGRDNGEGVGAAGAGAALLGARFGDGGIRSGCTGCVTGAACGATFPPSEKLRSWSGPIESDALLFAGATCAAADTASHRPADAIMIDARPILTVPGATLFIRKPSRASSRTRAPLAPAGLMPPSPGGIKGRTG
ncbi:MAG: hypothetical protein ABIQ98_06630 [Sphingomicrobium sp.]